MWRLAVSGGVALKVLEGILGIFAVLEGGIYYIDRLSGDARLQYFEFATRRSTTVARSLGNVGLDVTASPDGRTILYSRMDSSIEDLILVENFPLNLSTHASELLSSLQSLLSRATEFQRKHADKVGPLIYLLASVL